jgi:hypothetical protein
MKYLLLLGATFVAGYAATPASAALGPIVAPCALTDISPNAVACTGFYDGNVIAGNSTRRADQQTALGLIGYDGPDITAAYFGSLPTDPTGDGVANFGVPMFGDTWIAIHFGNGATGPVPGIGGTAFYRLNFGVATNAITVNWGAGSTGILYKTSVAPPPPPPPPVTPPIPEPATWAMLIAGFGLVGATARRRKTLAAA